MQVNFENILICDVVVNDYKGKSYPQLVVYNKTDRQLYRIGFDYSLLDEMKTAVNTQQDITAELTTYQGKNKFKLVV